MLKKYHPGKAVVAAIVYAIPFIILPLLFLRAFQTFLPESINLEFQLDLRTLETLIITIGASVVAMAFMTALFAKGLLGRALFGSARQAAKFAWLYFFFNAGFITILLTIEGGQGLGPIPIQGFAFSVHFVQLLYILYVAVLVMALYFVAEYAVYRRVVQEQYYVEPSYY